MSASARMPSTLSSKTKPRRASCAKTADPASLGEHESWTHAMSQPRRPAGVSVADQEHAPRRRHCERDGHVRARQSPPTPTAIAHCKPQPPLVLPGDLSWGRAQAIQLGRAKWVNGTVLHYYFFDQARRRGDRHPGRRQHASSSAGWARSRSAPSSAPPSRRGRTSGSVCSSSRSTTGRPPRSGSASCSTTTARGRTSDATSSSKASTRGR